MDKTDKKFFRIKGWKEVMPSGAKYEYKPTGFEFGDKIEFMVYRNGERFDRVLLRKGKLL